MKWQILNLKKKDLEACQFQMTRIVRILLKSIFHRSSLRTLYFSEMHFFSLGPLIIQKWHFRKKKCFKFGQKGLGIGNLFHTAPNMSINCFLSWNVAKNSNPSGKLFWWVCSHTFSNYFLRKTLFNQYSVLQTKKSEKKDFFEDGYNCSQLQENFFPSIFAF